MCQVFYFTEIFQTIGRLLPFVTQLFPAIGPFMAGMAFSQGTFNAWRFVQYNHIYLRCCVRNAIMDVKTENKPTNSNILTVPSSFKYTTENNYILFDLRQAENEDSKSYSNKNKKQKQNQQLQQQQQQQQYSNSKIKNNLKAVFNYAVYIVMFCVL